MEGMESRESKEEVEWERRESRKGGRESREEGEWEGE